MLRALAIVIFVFLAASALISILNYNAEHGLVVSPVAVATSTPAMGSFSATGVIDYSTNNVGTMIPYLVYQDAAGNTRTKALIYCEAPAGQYSGSVKVTGTIEEESVCVDSITAV
jgi:hypothetical protein